MGKVDQGFWGAELVILGWCLGGGDGGVVEDLLHVGLWRFPPSSCSNGKDDPAGRLVARVWKFVCDDRVGLSAAA